MFVPLTQPGRFPLDLSRIEQTAPHEGWLPLAESWWAVGYRQYPIAVDVSGNDPADLAWLSEFLEPWCEAVPAGGGQVHVRMIRSDRRYREAERTWTTRRPAAALPIPCVRLDTRTVAFEAWSEGGALRLFDPGIGCHVILAEGGCVDVVAARLDHRAQLVLLGLIREIITGGVSLSRPVVDLHAAAFSADGTAVLVAGPKGSGKTSVLCHAIHSAGATLIANDRVFLQEDATRPVVVGIPTVVSIRPGTLGLFPQLLDRSEPFPALAPIVPAWRPADGIAPPTPPAAGTLLLSPVGFAGRLGAVRTARAPLRAILLPEVSADCTGWTLERLPLKIALAELEASRYGVAAHRDQPTLFGRLAQPDAGAAPAPTVRLEQVLTTVPTYRCRLGRDAYRQSAASLLASLG